jgi:hypothetical protein
VSQLPKEIQEEVYVPSKDGEVEDVEFFQEPPSIEVDVE